MNKKELEQAQSRAERLDAELVKTRADFESYRLRMAADVERARKKGCDDAALALLDVIDDCDRAIAAMSSPDNDTQLLLYGIEQLRSRAIRHFEQLGYISFADAGDSFDPHLHEAVSVEPGDGPDGSIARVHRRGWMRETDVIRPAMVTVLQGSLAAVDVAPQIGGAALRRSQRRQRGNTTDYVCPYGIVDCKADCPGCSPPLPRSGEFSHSKALPVLADSEVEI